MTALTTLDVDSFGTSSAWFSTSLKTAETGYRAATKDELEAEA